MSEQEGQTVAVADFLAGLDGGLDEGEPTAQRQAELRANYEANIAAGKAPYEGVMFMTLGEVLWILRERRWSVEEYVVVGTPHADLRKASLMAVDMRGVALLGANLEGADLSDAILSNADLFAAQMHDTYLEAAFLNGANLDHANLSAANLEDATLSGANLSWANLSGARLIGTDLTGADLRFARLDRETQLRGAKLDAHTWLGDIDWQSVPLALVPLWPKRLGDEQAITRSLTRQQRITTYRDTARAYRGLSIALRSQGLLIPASNYRLREQVLERKATFLSGNVLGWAFSWLLNLVAGYGERPIRSFIGYLLVILGFAGAFFAIGSGALGIGGHEAVNSPVSALVFSVTSFHGRGFFPGGGLALDDPITILAALEAIMGLFIEITFIATFTQRFFAR